MKISNQYVFNENNRDADLKKAEMVQKKLVFPKVIFFLMPLLFILLIGEELWAGSDRLDNSLLFIIFTIYMFVGIPLMIILTLIGSICPHCHQFQRPTSSSLGIDESKLFVSKGISPFIHWCSRCQAPLSVKAVNRVYDTKRSEQET